MYGSTQRIHERCMPFFMKSILTILVSVIYCSVFGQINIAIIKDPDGYTNIREGNGADFEVIGRINKNEPFQFTKSNDDWWAVVKPTFGESITGFVHKSRITPFASLKSKEKIEFIGHVYKREIELIKSNDWELRRLYHEPVFDFILDASADFISLTRNEELMNLFLTSIKLDSGSADEMPSWALGKIYIAQPEWTVEQIKKAGKTLILINSLEFGFENVSYGQESKIPNYTCLKNGIEKLR